MLRLDRTSLDRTIRGLIPASIAFALSLAAATAVIPALAPALAAGGGGGGGGGGGSGGSGGGDGGGAAGSGRTKFNALPSTCAKGQIFDVKRSKCVKAERDVLPDEYMTEYAYALAKEDRYEEALGVLDLLENPNTPRALNYRGYATRKLGRTDEGIGYYLASVALDPSYTQVREYLGEAYVVQGKIELANLQLTTIKGLCGTDCEEYEDLAQAIETATTR
jgi:tetratricopeptide (TPR) repeat protein